MSKLGFLRGLATKEGQAKDKSLLSGPWTGAATRHCQTELLSLSVPACRHTCRSAIAGERGVRRWVARSLFIYLSIYLCVENTWCNYLPIIFILLDYYMIFFREGDFYAIILTHFFLNNLTMIQIYFKNFCYVTLRFQNEV